VGMDLLYFVQGFLSGFIIFCITVIIVGVGFFLNYPKFGSCVLLMVFRSFFYNLHV